MSVFLNILIEFQKVIINIKDSLGKVVGILATLLYTLDGSQKTMASVWKGPPGKINTTINPIKTFTPRFITKALQRSQ